MAWFAGVPSRPRIPSMPSPPSTRATSGRTRVSGGKRVAPLVSDVFGRVYQLKKERDEPMSGKPSMMLAKQDKKDGRMPRPRTRSLRMKNHAAPDPRGRRSQWGQNPLLRPLRPPGKAESRASSNAFSAKPSWKASSISIGIIGGGLMGREMASAFARWCALTDVGGATGTGRGRRSRGGPRDWFHASPVRATHGDYKRTTREAGGRKSSTSPCRTTCMSSSTSTC